MSAGGSPELGNKIGRYVLTFIAVMIGFGLIVSACSGSGGSSGSVSTSAPSLAPTTPAYGLPDYSGSELDQAEAAARNLGVTSFVLTDLSGQNRPVTDTSIWQVCHQYPTGYAQVTFEILQELEDCSDPTPDPTVTDDSSGTSGYDSGTDDSSGSYGYTTDPTDDSSSGSDSSSGGSVDSSGGATAKCNDGTLSYSAHHRGTCSHHHGVAVWYN